MFESLAASLTQRREQGLYRQRRIVDSPQNVKMLIDGQTLINFSSNDYLGLANHSDVVKALQQGAQQYGAGSGAAHLICGHSRPVHDLEEALAEFCGRQRALIFSTGYMANIGIVTALLGRHDGVFEDRLNHASLIDAGQFSGASFQRFRHADTSQLEEQLIASQARQKLIISDGVFSMDGDIAPLPSIVQLAEQHDAWLMVDDAHGFGVLGKNGSGCAEHFALSQEQLPILMGTFGKAFGTFGAFVAGSDTLIEYLINEARSYVYTTALPPAIAVATLASLKLLQQQTWRREKLQDLIRKFRQGVTEIGLQLMDSDTPIQPIVIGEAASAVRMSDALMAKGFYVGAIRPPTVPKGSARLRVTLSAVHSESDINRLLEALSIVSREMNV